MVEMVSKAAVPGTPRFPGNNPLTPAEAANIVSNYMVALFQGYDRILDVLSAAANAEARKVEAEDGLAGVNDSIQRAKAELDSLKAQYGTMKNEMVSLKQKAREEIQADRDTAAKEISDARAALQQELDDKRAQFEKELQLSTSSARGQLTKLNNQITEADAKLVDLNVQIADAENQLTVTNQKLQAATDSLAALKAKL